MKKLPEEEVIVKISSCQKCDGIVTTAVKHLMTTKTKNIFMKDVLNYNLSVKEKPLLEMRAENANWCEC